MIALIIPVALICLWVADRLTSPKQCNLAQTHYHSTTCIHGVFHGR